MLRQHRIPLQFVPVLLAICLTVGGLISPLPGITSPSALRQCDPALTTTGCPLAEGEPALATLSAPDMLHSWVFELRETSDFTIDLSNLAFDARLSAYGPDGAPIGISDHPGWESEALAIVTGALGAYLILVDSPASDFSSEPYILLVSRAPIAEADLPQPLIPMEVPPIVVAGPVLFTDAFDDATSGRLPRQPAADSSILRGYVDGEYQIVKSDPVSTTIASVTLPGTYADVALAVDARLAGDTVGRAIYLACRRQRGGESYRLVINPDSQNVALVRFDGSGSTTTLAQQSSPAIRRGGEWNRIELDCFGTTLSAMINGSRLISVQDGTYTDGNAFIGVYGSNRTAEVRLDNLVVSREASAETVPAPAPLTPTVPRATSTPRPAPGPYDGIWGGRTNTNSGLSFTVASNVVTRLTVDGAATGASCITSGSYTFRPNMPLDGNAMSVEDSGTVTVTFTRPGESFDVEGTVIYRISGRFSSPTAASGSYEYILSIPEAPVRCDESARGTWTASRGGE